MKLLVLALLAFVLVVPTSIRAEEEVLSGHVAYHSPDKKFTLVALNGLYCFAKKNESGTDK